MGIREEVADVTLPIAVALFRATGPAMNVAVAFYVAHWLGLQPTLGADDRRDRGRRGDELRRGQPARARSATSARSRRSRWRSAFRSRRWRCWSRSRWCPTSSAPSAMSRIDVALAGIVDRQRANRPKAERQLTTVRRLSRSTNGLSSGRRQIAGSVVEPRATSSCATAHMDACDAGRFPSNPQQPRVAKRET